MNTTPVPGPRVALLADIHGNRLALDAVLDDIESRGGVDGYWLLGDYAAIGPDPAGALERLSRLPNTTFIRGNTDRYLSDGDQPWPLLPDAQQDPALFGLHVQVARSMAWTTGAVAATGWLPWLAQLPLEVRAVLPDGTRALAVHASPGTDDGFGLHPFLTDDEARPHIAGADADLIVVGHTHLPFDRKVDGVRAVNPGSVSNPLPPDLRASYAVLHAEPSGYGVEFRRVEYDREATAAAARAVRHPAWEYIASFMRGERRPDWLRDR